jgi:protein phosphatase-4 regulatory subunit 3
LVNQNLFEPILQIVLDTMPRDSLLNSAALELFEFVRREQVSHVLKDLVTNHRETLESITYVDTFQMMVRRYDQMREPTTTQELEHSFTSVESGTPARNMGPVNGGKWGEALRELDPDEEAYFNGDDDDDEDENLSNGVRMNGASPVRPLVNYPDDDGDDVDMDILATSAPSSAPSRATTAKQASPEEDVPAKEIPSTPPERISERRKREEEEEDELLASLSSSGTKRKASPEQRATGSPTLQKLRRKNSMTNAKDNGGPRKISITVSSKGTPESGSEE